MRVPILMYHQVSVAPPPLYARYSVTFARFTRQMEWLANRGYTTLSLAQLHQCRAGTQSWPRRPVVITFDDGFADAMTSLLEVLPRFGFRATVFLVSGALGGVSTWTRRRGVEMPIADWTCVRDLVAAGCEIGSHTVTHPRLAELTSGVCLRELIDSRERLQDRLGRAVPHLAYPFGSVTTRVRDQAVDAGYTMACSGERGLSTADDDPMLLHRVPVFGDDSMLDFTVRLCTARSVREWVETPRGAGRRIGHLVRAAAVRVLRPCS
jgi:peptidoglycan/xylan/chitin deacetylase (PgdA/CDA1 family)